MDTFIYLERATMQWLVQCYHRHTLRWATNKAMAEFARTYPECITALFDHHFVNTHVLPLLIRAATEDSKVTAAQITELWARQISMLPTLRQKHITLMILPATHFLCMVADALMETQIGRNANVLNVNVLAETVVG